jgi:hypothetical protein
VEHVIELVKALAWPFSSIIIAILFRHELRTAASRLSSLSFKGLKADFKQEIENLAKDVEELPPPEQTMEISERTIPGTSDYETLFRIAEISPRAAILEAWRDIEVITKQVTDILKISIRGQIAGVKAIRELVSKGIMPASSISVYERLRTIRSKAAHAPDYALDAEQSEDYLNLAKRLYSLLEFALYKASR